MKRTLRREPASTADMKPVQRGMATGAIARGVQASSAECDLCHFGCTFLPPQEAALCHIACDLTLCP